MGRHKLCEHCSSPHHPSSYHTEKRLTDKGFPTHDPKYKTSHEEATKAEKKAFPEKDYDKLNKLDRTLPKHELVGKNTRSGRIEVSEKVPRSLRREVAFHEKVENRNLKRLDKKK